jgi:hypothetical protein
MHWLSPVFYKEAKEKWIKKLLTSVEMKYFRRTEGHTLYDHKRNEYILEEMKVGPVDEKTSRYKSHWLRYVTGLNNNRMPKIMLNCGTNGRRGLGRPLKRLLDAAETRLSRSNS